MGTAGSSAVASAPLWRQMCTGREAVHDGGQGCAGTASPSAQCSSELATASKNEVCVHPNGLVHFLPLFLKEVLMCI